MTSLVFNFVVFTLDYYFLCVLRILKLFLACVEAKENDELSLNVHIGHKIAWHSHHNCIFIMHRPRSVKGLLELVHWLKFQGDCKWVMTGMSTLRESHRLHTSSVRCIHIVISEYTTPYEFSKRTQNVHLGSLHKQFWVTFVKSSIEEFYEEAHLPISLEMLAVQVKNNSLAEIFDIYRVNQTLPLRIANLGNWTLSKGVQICEASMTARRTDLEGIQLKVGIKENWPVSYTVIKDGEIKWDGFFPVVWNQLLEALNATSQFIPYNTTGSLQPDGSWSGMIGEALRGKVDVIVSELTLDERRSRILDFTQPLLKSRYQIFFKHPGMILDWMGILKPFPMPLWSAILFWVWGATLSITICHYVCMRVGIEDKIYPQFSFLNFLFFTLQTLSQQGKEDVPRSVSCRILFFSSYVVSAVVIPAYSASLISSLTQKTPYRPFSSLEEMLDDGTFKLLVANNTAEYDYFSYSNDPTITMAYNKLILPIPENHIMKNTHHGIDQVCYQFNNYAIFGIELVTIPWIQRDFPDCVLMSMIRPMSTVHLAMALPKGHPFHSLMVYNLGVMTDVGLIRRLTSTAWPMKKTAQPESWTEVHTEEVFQIFVFLACAVLLSIFILIFEIFIFKKRRLEDQETRFKVLYPLKFYN